jgi:hypothetical protein
MRTASLESQAARGGVQRLTSLRTPSIHAGSLLTPTHQVGGHGHLGLDGVEIRGRHPPDAVAFLHERAKMPDETFLFL